MMSAKFATLGLFRIKLFENKGYGVIIFVHDVTNVMNQIITRESNCTLLSALGSGSN